MAGAYSDRVKETATTTGTGNFTLAGAVTGFESFNTAFGTGVSFVYAIEGVDGSGVPSGEWEVGLGNLSGSTTLVRDIVIQSSNSDAAVSFSAGSKNVFSPFPGYAAINAMLGFDLQYGMP